MELALITGQRREDIASFVFKDEVDGFLQVVQSKTGARLRISTSVTLECIDLSLGEVIRRCRDRVLSKHLVHHHRTISRAKAGTTVMLDTISKEFAAARDRAAEKLGLDLGASRQPSMSSGRWRLDCMRKRVETHSDCWVTVRPR